MKLINQLKWCLLLWKGYFLDHRRGGFRITTSCSELFLLRPSFFAQNWIVYLKL